MPIPSGQRMLGSDPDLAIKGRNAGENVGNYRYLDGVAGEPGAV